MIITRTSWLTGRTHTRRIDVTREQYQNWRAGALIQVAMPNLTADEREFIKTGATPEEWNAVFPENNE